MEKGGTSYYYHYDGLGSVTNLTDSTSTVSESYSYDVFGKPNTASTIGNPLMFTGREYDSETGLYYYRGRYYSPQIGRFLQTDPIGYYGGTNLYAYCSNDPINWIDPWGLLGEKEVKEQLDKHIGDKMSEGKKQKIADFTGKQIQPWHTFGLIKQDPKAFEELEKRVREALKKADKETKEAFDELEKIKKEFEEQQRQTEEQTKKQKKEEKGQKECKGK